MKAAALNEAILNAIPVDVNFKDEPINGHSMSKEVKTGFRIANIGGHTIPDDMRITYVRSEGPTETYYYVIDHLGRSEPKQTVVETEAEARQYVLESLKTYVRGLKTV